MTDNTLHLIGYAFGLAGADIGTAQSPLCLQQSSYIRELEAAKAIQWDAILREPAVGNARVDEVVNLICSDLAKKVSALVQKKQRFSVIGGDHTSAIGTWSGVYDALHAKGDLGLIWIDAHMDSHTPETTESGRIHGMPLACLMGYGYPTLTCVLHRIPKIKPHNVALIGVRSFERGEAQLLERLNVRVYFMEEVLARGFTVVLQEAIELISTRTIGYGLSIDLDALDPQDVPGVGVPEPQGIQPKDFYTGLAQAASDLRLVGTEIVEFDPQHDRDNKTEKLLVKLLEILAK